MQKLLGFLQIFIIRKIYFNKSASIYYWNTIGSISEKVLDYRHKPQSSFLKTAQGILRTYDKKKAEIYREKFLKNDLPANGFESKEKYKLTTSLIDWVLFFAISSVLLRQECNTF